jgi:YD repeat-containing protein
MLSCALVLARNLDTGSEYMNADWSYFRLETWAEEDQQMRVSQPQNKVPNAPEAVPARNATPTPMKTPRPVETPLSRLIPLGDPKLEANLVLARYNQPSVPHVGMASLNQETASQTIDYTYNEANWLIDMSGASYTWDANGNLLSDNVSEYTYDPANRLSSVEQENNSYTFAYDGLGDRLQQTVNSQTTNYTLDLNAGLTQVLDDGTDTYLYGVDRIAQADAANTDDFLGDALGSVRQLADNNGEFTLGQSYDPYGNVISSIGNDVSVYGFTGELSDPYIESNPSR